MSTNKTSSYLENNATPEATASRVLLLLKRRTLQTAAEIGGQLGITAEAARQQLAKLADEGLISVIPEAGRVGRPTHRWRLTMAGHARFPDGHADMAVQIIQTIRTTLGEAALEQVIAARTDATLAAYRAQIDESADLPTRVAQLSAIRSREGYMAEWQVTDDGYLLIEHHCPICAAASMCQAFCRSELTLFRAILGPDVDIQRTAHVLADDTRCAYLITPVR
jgi:predicted ArsR family transcriptional regulator